MWTEIIGIAVILLQALSDYAFLVWDREQFYR